MLMFGDKHFNKKKKIKEKKKRKETVHSLSIIFFYG